MMAAVMSKRRAFIMGVFVVENLTLRYLSFVMVKRGQW